MKDDKLLYHAIFEEDVNYQFSSNRENLFAFLTCFSWCDGIWSIE